MGNESKNLWISLGAGVFAAFMLYSYTQEKKAEVEKVAGNKVRVVVARQDINQMSNIYDDVLEVVEKSKSDVEPDAFTAIPDVVGNVAAISIKKGQTILKNAVIEPGPETGMATQIAMGKRAVTIPISDDRANAKMIRPGDRVDIIATVDSGKGVNQKRDVTVLMQDVVIIATGYNVNNNIPRTIERDPSGKGLIQNVLTGDTKYSNVTIEANLDQALQIIYLVNTNPSAITLLLRNPADKIKQRTVSSSGEDIQRRILGEQPQTLGQPAGVNPQLPSFPKQ